jgi:antitoxin ParD1/3/4
MANRTTVNISLTPELGAFLQSRVASGRYQTASEVVREALRLMEQKDELRAVQLQQLRSRIDAGLAEAERGEGVDGEAFIQGMLEDLDSRGAKRKAG